MTYEEASRQAQKAFEPFCAMIYFVPERVERYKTIGLNRRQGYFCSRAAAMGQVSGATVAAAFYNFNPALVIPLVESGWQATTPAAVLEQRRLAVQDAAHRLITPAQGEADLMPGVPKALEQVKQATAGLDPCGRPLFAAHQSLPWPEEPLTALWHGLNMLREYRGDGHIAALLVEGISGVESILLQAAYSSRISLPFLLQSRQWQPAEVEVARARLTERGLLQDGASNGAGQDQDGVLTAEGQDLRERVEQHTDRLTAAPFAALGESASAELIGFVRQISRRVVERGGLVEAAPPPRA